MFTVLGAHMSQTEEGEYVGQVQFAVEGHPHAYEITLHRDKQGEWAYSLHFAKESGSEEQILQVEDMLEADDSLFDMLVDAALATLA